ncbi:hypothetical protein BKA80DRAFT_263872, partial [Phyllosticta citrichinensis]
MVPSASTTILSSQTSRLSKLGSNASLVMAMAKSPSEQWARTPRQRFICGAFMLGDVRGMTLPRVSSRYVVAEWTTSRVCVVLAAAGCGGACSTPSTVTEFVRRVSVSMVVVMREAKVEGMAMNCDSGIAVEERTIRSQVVFVPVERVYVSTVRIKSERQEL